MKTKVRKAVFPVGGLGTRFLPVTKALPKEMLPVGSRPLIQHAFEEAVNAGIEEFIFITGRNKNIIINHFDCVYELEKVLNDAEKHDALRLTKEWVPEAGKIAFIRQQHPKGLGHAVWCARHFIKDEPFAILNADELSISNKSNSLLSEMVELYNATGSNVIAVSDVDINETSKYGILDVSSDDGSVMQVKDMVEKPLPENAPSNISIIGRYILSSDIFAYLEAMKDQEGGEIQLTDAMKAMLNDQKFLGYRLDGRRFDCGNQLGFLKANIEFALLEDYDGALRNYVKSL